MGLNDKELEDLFDSRFSWLKWQLCGILFTKFENSLFACTEDKKDYKFALHEECIMVESSGEARKI